jgi:hypothetical protein
MWTGISGPKREEVVGDWRKLRNLFASPNIIPVIKSRRMRLAGHAVSMEEMTNAYKILIGKLEGKRPLERTGHRWGGNIRMDLREMMW